MQRTNDARRKTVGQVEEPHAVRAHVGLVDSNDVPDPSEFLLEIDVARTGSRYDEHVALDQHVVVDIEPLETVEVRAESEVRGSRRDELDDALRGLTTERAVDRVAHHRRA